MSAGTAARAFAFCCVRGAESESIWLPIVKTSESRSYFGFFPRRHALRWKDTLLFQLSGLAPSHADAEMVERMDQKETAGRRLKLVGEPEKL
jgi:hypothetical protein